MASRGKTHFEAEVRRPLSARDAPPLHAEPSEAIRLRHLCKEDKAKIGELLSVMIAERSRSKECLHRYAADFRECQSTVRRLRKQNRRLSKERELLQQQLDQSLKLLSQCRPETKRDEMGETFGTSRFRPDGKDGEAQTCLLDSSKENSSRPSAVGEVKSLRQDLANLSLSLRQLNGSVMESRAPLAPLQLNDSAFNPSGLQSKRGSTRRNALFESGRPSERREMSPRPNPVATPSTLPSTSFLHSPRNQYDESLFELLEEMESGSIAQPTPKHKFNSGDSELAYSTTSSLYSVRKTRPETVR